MTQGDLSTELQPPGFDITSSAAAKTASGQRHVYPDEIKALKEVLHTTFDKIFYGEEA